MSNRIVVIKGKGGLGNRLLCALSGFHYADLSGRTPFVDWRDQTYSNDGTNAFYELYQQDEPVVDLATGRSVYPAVWEGNLQKTVNDIVEERLGANHDGLLIHRKLSVMADDLRRPEDLVVFWNYSHRLLQLRSALVKTGAFKDSPTFVEDVIRHTLRTRLQPRKQILDRATQLEAELFKGRTLAVHVRYTDLKVNLSKCIEESKALYKRGGFETLFLATDNNLVKQEFDKHFPRVVSSPKWFPEGGSGTLHQNLNCTNRLDAGREAIIDQLLLGRAQGLVYSSISTFSWIASILSEAEPYLKIDQDRSNTKQQFKRWLRSHI